MQKLLSKFYRLRFGTKMSNSISISRKMFFVIIIALLVLVFIVGMATSMFLNQQNSSNMNPTPTPNPTLSPTIVPTPTSTPTPTPLVTSDTKSGKAIQIQSISYPSTGGQAFTIYVQNVGDSDIIFSNTNSVFINGAAATGTWTMTTLAMGNTASYVAISSATLPTGVQSITFKVMTTDGTFSQVTQQFTIK
jgi:hypothetical protein